ncbi:Ion transport 2 [Pseudoxanthomonas kalamensis DSM 18571]|uniref:potassium channel family protein n=1 Tax=Pseudoxanthomonas kalamensis TaxID=289483 RepID=UPI001391C2CD|nr:potassium channel family protein [Pseudoxanthomonas kalamensis]KAF1709403.1 Ion transport 2 [Pseudoxanthomonas kalamensis DSM 18571]
MDLSWLIPPGQWAEHLLVTGVVSVVTALVVVIHYEGLKKLAQRYSGKRTRRRRRVMLRIIFALLALHIAEIWCYGLSYWGLLQVADTGFVLGEQGMRTVFDAIYFSATTYTTLGLGDMAPVGAIRLVVGMESLTGFLLVTWSASFTYLEMSRYWRRED